MTTADNLLFFRYEDGTMMLIEATPEGYKPKGHFKIPAYRARWSHPVVLDGKRTCAKTTSCSSTTWRRAADRPPLRPFVGHPGYSPDGFARMRSKILRAFGCSLSDSASSAFFRVS